MSAYLNGRRFLTACLFSSVSLPLFAACGGGSPPPPAPQDEVWCDVTTPQCTAFVFPPACTGPANIPCGCTSVSAPVTVSPPTFGQPTCFFDSGESPAVACNSICNQASLALNPVKYPDVATNCTASVNKNAGHPFINGQGFQPQGCINGVTEKDFSPNFSRVGTNSVSLNGSGNVSFGSSSTNAAITSGFFDFSAPATGCTGGATTCDTQINVVEVVFAPFNLAGDNITNLTIRNNPPILTDSGTLDVASNRFVFSIPQGIQFDAIAQVNGQNSALTVTSTASPLGSLDLTTGELTFQFSFTGSFSGNDFTATGTVTSSQVLAQTPTLTAQPVAATATSSCTPNVTLSATASSPVGSPVSLFYSIDGAAALPGPTASVPLTIGSHSVAITALDAQGLSATVTEPITVTDGTMPVFATIAPSQTVQSCSVGTGAVAVTVPSAQDPCTGVAAQVSGTVTRFNGAVVSIPVVNGTVSLPAGSGVISFTATGVNGLTQGATQPITVLAPATFYGSQGVALATDGATVNGTIYAGAGGSVSIGNDATVGNLFSLSPVVLHDRTIATLIDTNAALTRGNNDHIAAVSTAVPVLPAFPPISATFAGGAPVTVFSQQTRPLAPGQYGAVTVDSQGSIVLSAGIYDFTSLDVESQAVIVVPSATSEATQIFVRDSITYRGATQTGAKALAPLYLGYTGTSPVTIGSLFNGSVVAPNAALTLQSLNGAGNYNGEFFAKNVTLQPHTTVNPAPFSCH
jgi:hypothetical protein